jgi:hypothetical protein
VLLADAAFNELAGTQRWHPNKVGVLPQVEIRNYCPPNNLSLDALSSAQRAIGIQRQTAVPRDCLRVTPINFEGVFHGQ